VPTDRQLEDFVRRDAIASFASVRSAQSFHTVQADADGIVTHIGAMSNQDWRVNGGFFVLKREIFDHINEGEELVEQPFQRLAAARKLVGYRWDGFWHCMDTFKDKITFDRMEARGDCPWMVWQQPR
jgi:glucose-1-phosphate cytidylyltransferase